MFSLGSRSRNAAATVSPPIPESKTPIGRTGRLAFVTLGRRMAGSALTQFVEKTGTRAAEAATAASVEIGPLGRFGAADFGADLELAIGPAAIGGGKLRISGIAVLGSLMSVRCTSTGALGPT